MGFSLLVGMKPSAIGTILIGFVQMLEITRTICCTSLMFWCTKKPPKNKPNLCRPLVKSKILNPYKPWSNKGLNLAFPKLFLAWVMSSTTVMKLSAKLGHLHKTYRLRRVKSGIITSMTMQLLCCEQKQDKGEHTKLRRVKVHVSGLF